MCTKLENEDSAQHLTRVVAWTAISGGILL